MGDDLAHVKVALTPLFSDYSVDGVLGTANYNLLLKQGFNVSEFTPSLKLVKGHIGILSFWLTVHPLQHLAKVSHINTSLVEEVL